MPKKLLLVEDSLTIRKVFELALSRSDIAITAVDNGEDAVRLAGEILPDLVVADLTLPGKNGFAVAAELRAMEKTEKIPVLILSGTLVPLDEARFKASGAIKRSSPALGADGTVYIGRWDRHLYAVLADGRPRWPARASRAPCAPSSLRCRGPWR